MSGEFQSILLALSGLLAGIIDSIAGGGGLITVPTLSLVMGPGPHAIGTNKILATAAAGIALLVYARKGHLDWRKGAAFSAWIVLGAFTGSRVSPYVPVTWFKILLAVTVPLILWMSWKKDLWIARSGIIATRGTTLKIMIAGLGCGFYDGLWGPGGGTFMLLSLLFLARLPLFQALAASKLANTVSALSSLTGYALGGYVHPQAGVPMAIGITAGAFLGARYATQNAARAVRPVLAIVATALAARLIFG